MVFGLSLNQVGRTLTSGDGVREGMETVFPEVKQHQLRSGGRKEPGMFGDSKKLQFAHRQDWRELKDRGCFWNTFHRAQKPIQVQ